MPRIHVLVGQGDVYQCVVHAPTPNGNNSAGVAWATALKNSLLQPVSRLPVGNGAGQITTAENNDVVNGVLIEASFQWQDPGGSAQNRIDSLNNVAQAAVSDTLARYAELLKFFGQTVT